MSRLPASWLSGANDELTIRSITATLVSVPLRRALGTSIMRITESPLLLIGQSPPARSRAPAAT